MDKRINKKEFFHKYLLKFSLIEYIYIAHCLIMQSILEKHCQAQTYLLGSFASTSRSFLSQNAPDVGDVCALAFFITLSISLLLPAGKLGSKMPKYLKYYRSI